MAIKAYQIFYDGSDEGTEHWPFVYLHGAAEDLAMSKAKDDGFDDAMADILSSDSPIPGEGNHLCEIYGKPCVAVIRMGHGCLCGRVALLEDTDALKHALAVEEWS